MAERFKAFMLLTPVIFYEWFYPKYEYEIVLFMELYYFTLLCCCFALHYFNFGWPLPFDQETIDLWLFNVLTPPVLYFTVANCKNVNYFLAKDY
jgi:hypothetical protein